MLKKDFIKLSDYDLESLNHIIEIALKLKQNPDKKLLPGKQLVMIFQKNSTRTRVSFEIGINQLGGNAVYLNASNTQLGRGESISDTAKVISSYADLIMLRCNSHDDLREFAENSQVPVINGLSDFNHPCQVMADIMTFKELKGDIHNKQITWLGDANNMCNSWMMAAQIFGFKLNLALAAQYPVKEDLYQKLIKQDADITLYEDPNLASKNSDLIVTDTWVSMGDDDYDVRLKAFKHLQVNKNIMQQAKKDAIFMHCLPAHRGEEVTADVIDSKESVVFQEAENRLHIQKAIMCHLLNVI